MTRSPVRLGQLGLAGFLSLLVLSACQRHGPTDEQARVAQAFESWKAAVLDDQPEQAMAYLPRHVDDYLHALNSPPPADAAPGEHPGVDLLLRRALEKKVPVDLRSRLTLAVLFQRITERHLFNPRDLREITLGPAAVHGDRAGAEVYYAGALTAVRLPFVREDDGWKIDVMAILPYAETLLRLDRAVKGETEDEQVDQLVAKLPSL